MPVERPNMEALTIIGIMVAQELWVSGKLIKYRKRIWNKKFPKATSRGNISKLKTWATLGLVPIERPNVQNVSIIGTIVAQELRVSGKLIKYRKEIEKIFPMVTSRANISKIKTEPPWYWCQLKEIICKL